MAGGRNTSNSSKDKFEMISDQIKSVLAMMKTIKTNQDNIIDMQKTTNEKN